MDLEVSMHAHTQLSIRHIKLEKLMTQITMLAQKSGKESRIYIQAAQSAHKALSPRSLSGIHTI